MAPIFFKQKLFLLKAESAYGSDPTPTGAANAFLARNIVLNPMEGEDVSADYERPYIGAQPMFPVGVRTRIQFEVDLWPSGTAGTAPAWGPALKACGCGEAIVPATSVTYAPAAPGSHSSATAWMWHGLTKQVINGLRGTAELRWPAQDLPRLKFDMNGLFSEPAEAAQLSPTYSGFKEPLTVNDTNTTFEIESVPLVLRELVLNLGNVVEPRLLVGSESIVIPDRSETLQMRVEATQISTFDPYSAAIDRTLHEVELVHGVAAGAIATLNLPNVQLKRLSGFEDANGTVEWPLEGMPLPGSGNDQWSLALT